MINLKCKNCSSTLLLRKAIVCVFDYSGLIQPDEIEIFPVNISDSSLYKDDDFVFFCQRCGKVIKNISEISTQPAFRGLNVSLSDCIIACVKSVDNDPDNKSYITLTKEPTLILKEDLDLFTKTFSSENPELVLSTDVLNIKISGK